MESTYPQADAVDVPTNAALFVYGFELNSADDFVLQDEDAEVVPVEGRPVYPSGIDLVPLAPLEPNRRYTLRATEGPYERESF